MSLRRKSDVHYNKRCRSIVSDGCLLCHIRNRDRVSVYNVGGIEMLTYVPPYSLEILNKSRIHRLRQYAANPQ